MFRLWFGKDTSLWFGKDTSDNGFLSGLVVTEEFQEASGRTFLADAENAALRECDNLFKQEFLPRKRSLASEDDFIVMLQKRVHIHF